MSQTPFLVAALYKFVRMDHLPEKRAALQALCEAQEIRGTLLLAPEGINGTIAGPDQGIAAVLAALRALPGLGELAPKYSRAVSQPFYRMKVRLKREIVTMGQPDVDPNLIVGTYVKPQDWNALISDPDVLVLDTRNDYEVEIGTFERAVDPHTQSFRQFPDFVEGLKKQGKTPKVAMFCTGGIRCEKASAYMKSQGFPEVFHLEGGILKYLETVPEDESLWNGDCFVFDQRVSVRHGLCEGDYDLCHACRRPLAAEDKASPLFVEGVSCHRCHAETTPEQKRNFAERQKQIALARARGEAHIGATWHDEDDD